MGSWGVLAFDNDDANDWAYGLDDVADLSPVEAALATVEEARDYLQADEGANALAACEVLARLNGRPGYTNSYTEKVDAWVKAHPLKPPPRLQARASAVIDRILGEGSELNELWSEGDESAAWVASVEELRRRMTGVR